MCTIWFDSSLTSSGFFFGDFMENQQDIQSHIEREVQRKTSRLLIQHNEEISELKKIIEQCKSDLVRQHNIISKLSSEPLVYGYLLKVHKLVDPACFKNNDEIIVVDENSPHFQKGGKIILASSCDSVVDEHGSVLVRLVDDTEERFFIGSKQEQSAQIRLTQKADGTYAVVQIDGKPWEIQGLPFLDLCVGDSVKVKPDNKAIVDKAEDLPAGPICIVSAVLDQNIEVLYKGDKFLVFNPKNFTLEEGDRVLTDYNLFSVTKKLEKENHSKYKISQDLNVSWDDVGGLDVAKQELKSALEFPFLYPHLFNHYNIEGLRGVLLYGPPGCGKTLLARVCAHSIAKIHGKQAIDSAYIYVKSPEILDKWVGNTEREIRELFERGRKHYREHGYKAILAIDEADAIMPQRGTRRSSDISDTIVPMFLGEMDGIDSVQTKENPIVILMTNRADVLDPAITRPGRISRHIKIDRPNEITSIDILKIHSDRVPFSKEEEKEALLTITTADVFSKNHMLYRVNNEHDFTLGHCVNGAMLSNILEIAKINALHGDIENNTTTGVGLEDFRLAVKKVYRQQRGLNHSYDLQDFAESLGIQYQNMQVERCFGSF